MAQSVDAEGDPTEQAIDLTRIHNAAVETELRRKLQEGSPAFFEKAVADLLWAMGYGGHQGEREHLAQVWVAALALTKESPKATSGLSIVR